MAQERILIADDEADLLSAWKLVLSAQGYQVTAVQNGFEAIEAAKGQEFDLVLMDVRMPGLSGLEAYRTIKQRCPAVHGVAITGYGSMDTAIEALKLGMDDFLVKPFSLEQLRNAVSRALEKKRVEKEKTSLQALLPLIELSQAFLSVTDDFNALLQRIMQATLQGTAANLGVLLLKDEVGGDLQVCAVVTDRGIHPASPDYKLHDSILSRIGERAQAFVWQAESHQGPFFTLSTINTEISAAVALPLLVSTEIMGILSLAKKRGTFTPEDVEHLHVLAGHAAGAIQNARLFAHTQKAYEDLKQIDRLKSEFVSDVSHELRAPLHTIGGFVQLLLSNKVEDEVAQKECLETVYKQTQYLTQMVDNLLDVSRMETGRFELRKSPLQMHYVVQEIVKELQPLALQKQIALTDTTAPDSPLVLGDAQRLGQVLRNLVHNAIKFTPENGHITISSLLRTDELVIAVQDDGIGIPANAMPHIFERFYRAPNVDTQRVGGAGLGLYICKQIVLAHGGSIWVESNLGTGSTFYFSLPRAAL